MTPQRADFSQSQSWIDRSETRSLVSSFDLSSDSSFLLLSSYEDDLLEDAFEDKSESLDSQSETSELTANSQEGSISFSLERTNSEPKKKRKKRRKMESICECETDDYLRNGIREIQKALVYHFKGRPFPDHVSHRAKALFTQSYHIQSQQKAGDVLFTKSRGSSVYSSNRKRYARKKAFVVTSIMVALKEFGVSILARHRTSDKETVIELSSSVPGNFPVSLASVRSCCRALGLDDLYFR